MRGGILAQSLYLHRRQTETLLERELCAGPKASSNPGNLIVSESYFCEKATQTKTLLIESEDFVRFAACLRAKSGTHP